MRAAIFGAHSPLATLATVAAALVLFQPVTAHAGVEDHLARWLDPNPAFALRLEPAEIEAGAQLYGKTGGDAARQLMLASAGGVGLLGFDPLTRAGWSKAGFVAKSPFLGTFGQLGAHPYWRNRLALHVATPRAVDKTVARLARYVPGMSLVDRKHIVEIGKLIRAKGKTAKRAVTQLRRAGVVVMGKFGSGVLFIHRKRDVLLIDHVDTFGPGSAFRQFKWTRARKAVLTMLKRPPAGRGFAPRLKRGASRMLLTKGTALWLNPLRVIAASSPRTGSLGTSTRDWKRHWQRHCSVVDAAVRKGPLAEAAIHARIGARKIRAGIHWGLRKNVAPALGWKRADDAVIDTTRLVPKGTGSPAVAKGVLLVSNLTALAKRYRGTSRFSMTVFDDAAACGQESSWTMLLMGWPRIIGALTANVSKLLPTATNVFTNVRNLSFRAEKLSFSHLGLVGAFGVSMNAAAVPTVTKMTDSLFGHKRVNNGLTRWSRGPLQPFAFTSAGKTVMGAGYARTANVAGKATKTFFRTSPKRAAHKAGSDLARLRVNLPLLFNQLAASDSAFKPLATLINAVAAEMTGRLVAAKRRLDLRFTIHLK